MAGSVFYRLPRRAIPRRYELEFEPHLGSASFEGQVTITLDIVEPTDQLVLNATELEITEAAVETPESTRIVGRISLDEAEQRVSISLPDELSPATGYRLRLAFTGTLNDQLHGFYRSTFRAEDGQEHVIATTQFEPSDARRAFPCWDEPDFKATFEIRIVVDEGLTALSNSAMISNEPLEDGRRRVTFAETMIMSTYLVAFLVGQFETTEPKEVDGVPVRIATVAGRSELTGYAVDVASHALSFLSRYFEIPYPADKIDHVAVPDFAFGAMENLGCVTYRENALLADPRLASQAELQRVATVVAHETAHMWFGDLVTMKWWDGIWLNEAFATFMEMTTTDAFRPDWQVWTSFGAGKSAAMTIDALRATRPIEFPVGRPEEAEAMFDVLTYQKGGSVLRMLEQYLGPEVFRKGISHYLRLHAYGNTETSDLWDAIETISGEPVRAIMHSWISQGGYPVITTAMTDDPGTVSLSQRRFVYRGGGDTEIWAVPVNLRASVAGKVQTQRILLTEREATISFDGPVDWIVVNDGAWGFYRVRYSPDLTDRLRSAGITNVLGPMERLALVVDTWAAVVAGGAELGEWFSIVEAVADDDDPDVWAAVAAVLSLLDLIASEEDRTALQAFVHRIGDPVWSRLGWEPDQTESMRTATARARVLSALGLVGRDPELGREAAERLMRFLGEPTDSPADPAESPEPTLSPDLVGVVARVAVSIDGEAIWSSVLDHYRAATTNPQDKLRYLYALADTRDRALRDRTLEMTLGAEIRSQDAPFVIAAVLTQRGAAEETWDWVEARWPEIKARFPAGLLARIIEGITTVVEPDLAARIKRFCEQNEIPLTGPRLAQLLERMDINVSLAGRVRGTYAETLS